MAKNELYEEHLQEMFGMNLIDNYSDEEIDRVFDRLLQCLPNHGKLYKYRSMEGQAFNYAYDGLEKGYIYLARANTLNDDMDCTLIFDPEKMAHEMAEDFSQRPWFYLDNWVKVNADQLKLDAPIDIQVYQNVMSCVDRETWEINQDKAIEQLLKFGITRQQAEDIIGALLKFIQDKIEEHKEAIIKPISSLVNFNAINKQDICVFSMSELFDSNAMWGLYANSNNGFCIEYDFQKALHLPKAIKRLLINTYKVIYKDELDEYSFRSMTEFYISGQKDTELMRKANMEYLMNLITKTSEWSSENEWRILLYALDDNNKIFADIVSGIIIDERALDSDNAKNLIKLSNARGWNIRVRRKNKLGTKHIYEALNTEVQ